MEEPLRAREARLLLRKILDEGVVTYSQPHAIERLAKWKLTMVDCENVMRGGVVDEAEWENGGWRHQVRTPLVTVVVEFLSEEEVLVVTAWRKR